MRADTTRADSARAARVRCSDVTRQLSEAADGSRPLPPEVEAHVERCLRCQVEAIRYRRVLRSMRQLRGQLSDPDPGLLVDILGTIEAAGDHGAARSAGQRRRVAYVAAATAAGAAGALVIAARSRRGLAG